MIESDNTEITSSKRIFGLDFMRAIAIIAVLSSHILWIYPEQKNLLTQFCVLFGFLGVEIFFVLSGFLIGSILYHLYVNDDFNRDKVFYFLKRRWFRTLPNYYLFLVLNLVVALIIGYSIEGFWKYLFFLQNATSTMMSFFTESWSLSIEEYAYVILPFALLLFTKILKPSNKKYYFLIVVISLMLFFLVTKLFYNATTSNISLSQWNLSLKAVVIYRIDAILMGVVFSWLYINFQFIWKKAKWIAAGLGMFLFLAMFVGVGFFQLLIENYQMFWNVFYLPITSFTIALFLPLLSEWKTSKLPFKNVIVTISLISYSIYLIHYGIVLQLMKHFIRTENLTIPYLHLYAFAFLCITFILSYYNYHYFEKRMTKLREKSVFTSKKE